MIQRTQFTIHHSRGPNERRGHTGLTLTNTWDSPCKMEYKDLNFLWNLHILRSFIVHVITRL